MRSLPAHSVPILRHPARPRNRHNLGSALPALRAAHPDREQRHLPPEPASECLGLDLPAGATGSDLFAGEVDGVLRALLGQASEADHALPLELQNVLAYEQFLSVAGPYEGPVCALVDQY